MHGFCEKGHYGNLCYVCKLGYSKFQKASTCYECASSNWAFVAKVTLVLTVMLIWVGNFLLNLFKKKDFIDILS